MATGPTASFKYLVYLDRDPRGGYTVANSYQAVYTGNLAAYDDVTTAPGDSNTVLGDVANDTFSVQFAASGVNPVRYIGKQTGGDKSGIIGQRYARFILYTNDASYGPAGGNSGPYGGHYSLKSGQAVSFAADNPDDPATQQVLCYASGTMIRTARGDVAVEDLAIGDIAVTASGGCRPIRWLGHRHVSFAAPGTRSALCPVRILAGAFDAGLPARDLIVSPGHPVLVGADEEGVGGHLVPAMCLINGTTIDRVPVDGVTYWHVELDAHDILLAEGLPTESYLDWGDRAFFSEAEEHALVNPDFVVPGLGARCRPVAIDGPVVEAERRRLDAAFATRLATACAWPKGDSLGV